MRLEHVVSVCILVFAVSTQNVIGEDDCVTLMDGMVKCEFEQGELFWQERHAVT